MTSALIVEILATGFNLIYIVLLIREKIFCWPFGIIGSLLSVYLFFDAKLYSETILYLFYVGMGFWGWVRWSRRAIADGNPVVSKKIMFNVVFIIGLSFLAVAVGYGFQAYTDAERPYLDAVTTVFSFFATYLEVTKALEAWLYWVVINAVSIWLYADRALDIYAALIGLYSVLSVWGFINWRKAYRHELIAGEER
jgi:nicotinamide mononucleotide transporter